MKVYQIDYDLRKQRNYAALYEQIRSYGTYCHPLESTWIIATQQSAEQIRDKLTKTMDGDDGLLVTRLQGEAAWRNLSNDSNDEVTKWLKQQLNTATV
jgi:hypothetical protein